MKNTITVRNEAPDARAAIEAKRGIVRDAQGQIIRSPDWKRERIAFLKSKVELYETRIKHATAKIKQLQADLRG